MKSLLGVERRLRDAAKVLAYAGGGLVLLDAFWITVSVFRRYVLNDPDPVVTEAAALLLLPLAFAGLAYSFAQDANPKVSMLIDALPKGIARCIETVNAVIVLAVGLLFTSFAGSAAIRSYHSGAASSVIEWPEYFLWVAVGLCAAAFTLLALVRLISQVASLQASRRA